MMYVIPVFPCTELARTLAFYEALGGTVTHEQTKPYVYGAVDIGGMALQFTGVRGGRAKQVPVLCLVMVEGLEGYHEAFSDGLRAHYGRVPTVGEPRMTRLRAGQTRFYVFDPDGNMLLFIAMDEPPMDYEAVSEAQSPLAQALERAAFARDTYTNDRAAANLLDKALARAKEGAPVDRGRVLAARAELAVAMGDGARARELQAELAALELPDEVCEAFAAELEAPAATARWIEGDGGNE